jgi:hypothetical protein
MKETKSLPAILGGRVVIMSKLLLLVALCFAIPALSYAQGPLAASYTPSIDTTCTHPQYAANVWMTDTMQKILQSNTTAATDSCYITIYATQGEFADFQVHVVAPSGGYSALTVSSTSFVQSSPSAYTIPAPSTSANNIVVYREAYIPVTTVTATASVYYNATGNYPDPLIPAIDPYFHQVTNAFPVSVAANNTQSAWVDVYIPPAAPSGFYLGSITVSNSGTTLATMPVVIGVWQWPSTQNSSMPATPTLPTQLQYGWGDFCYVTTGSIGSCPSYPGAGGNGNTGNTLADADGGVLFLDHRWTMNDPVESTSSYAGLLSGVASKFPSAKPILAGGAETTVNYRSGNNGWSTIASFMSTFGATKHPAGSTGTYPAVTPLSYAADEPGSTASNWTSICSQATSAHANSPAMPILVTTEIADMNDNSGTSGCSTQGVTNSVDIMVANITLLEPNGNNAPAGLTRSQYSSWLSHTNPDGITPSLWSYISCSDAGTCGNGTVGNSSYNYPNYNVDSRPAGNRAMEWMTYLHQQTGELYYYTTCLWESGCVAGGPKDPWLSVYSFGNNGDGTLVYPSTYLGTNHVTLQSGSALTTPLWIGDIRLKNMRDGGQDWEYMNALTVAGQGAYVTTQIQTWITNSYTYEYTGTGLQVARLALGTALHQLTYPATLLPPPSLSGTVQ